MCSLAPSAAWDGNLFPNLDISHERELLFSISPSGQSYPSSEIQLSWDILGTEGKLISQDHALKNQDKCFVLGSEFSGEPDATVAGQQESSCVCHKQNVFGLNFA